MCEACIRSSISTEKDTAQVKCKICGKLHTFKMAAGGLVVANDNYVRLATNGRLPEDLPALLKELGPVTDPELVLRSLPVNVELMELVGSGECKPP